jgi:hypothetical protein
MKPMDELMLLKIYREQISNDTAKVAFLNLKDELIQMKRILSFNGNILEERWISRPTGFAIHKNHVLFQLVEDILQHTIATGIPQRRKEYYEEMITKFEPEIEDDEPKVLTLDDLSFGFNIVLIALGVSCVVFAMEIIYYQLKIKTRRWTRRFLGKLFVLLNVLQWLRRYHA